MNIEEAVIRALKDIEFLIPKLVISIILVCIFFVIAIVLNRVLSKVFEIVKIEELFKPIKRYTGMAVSFTSLILGIVNVAIALTALYTISSVAFPEWVDIINAILDYFARVVSVVFLIAVVFVAVSRIAEKIAVEEKMKNFMTLIMLFIVIVLLIDVTNLSREIKSALAWGLSIGIGISMGVFSAWFFFRDLIRR